MGVLERMSSSRLQGLLLAALAGVMVAVVASGSAQASGHEESSSPRVKRGDAVFHQRCVVCHNKQAGDTTPFGPPNLHGIFREKVLTPAQAATIIHDGKDRMPSFGAILKPSEIQDVIAYLKTQ